MQITKQPNHPVPLKHLLGTDMELIQHIYKKRDISGGFPVSQYEIYAISDPGELTEINFKNI